MRGHERELNAKLRSASDGSDLPPGLDRRPSWLQQRACGRLERAEVADDEGHTPDRGERSGVGALIGRSD